jgi:hypothetical protein
MKISTTADPDRYAEGNREPSECGFCRQPTWITYHGPRRNHSVEQRVEERCARCEGVTHPDSLPWRWYVIDGRLVCETCVEVDGSQSGDFR